jgi:hypothetical protein
MAGHNGEWREFVKMEMFLDFPWIEKSFQQGR